MTHATFITTSVLIAFMVGFAEGVSFLDCCNLGRRFATSIAEEGLRKNCMDAPITLDPGCQNAFDACCVESRNLAACEFGIGVAKNKSSCRSLDFKNTAAIIVAKQCCSCCSLAITWNATIPTSENGWCSKASDMCADRLEEFSVNTTSLPTQLASGITEQAEPDLNSCPLEHIWNPERRVCENIIIACPYRFFLDRNKGHCVKYEKELPSCSSGHRHNTLTLECEDINECAENQTICDGKEYFCINKPGSYQCLCKIGYRMDVNGQCTDIDECSLGLDNCHAGQRCNNKAGSFKCVRLVGCGFGYTLDDESQECQDIDECKTIDDICEVGMKCFNMPGSYICKEESCPKNLYRNLKTGECQLCRRGYRFNNETRRCKDVDECKEGLHNCNKLQRCENNPGSFQCRNRVVCELGFRMSINGMTCEDINECSEKRHECQDPYVCVNTQGTYICRLNPCNSQQTYDNTLQLCQCKEGYREVQGSCHDIDECGESKRPLCKKDDVCVNIPGSFFCEPYSNCEKGFLRPNNYSACIDINECARGIHKCGPHSRCINLPGSYACHCDHGFRKNDAGVCEDVDECRMMTLSRTCPGKHLHCINVIGSFVCQCAPGYKKISWSKVCEDIDECRRNRSICGIHTCHNLDGTYMCRCLRGYRMGYDRKSCSDINECQQFRSICPNSKCINTEGSYQCECPTGYRPNSRGICTDIDECAMHVCRQNNEQCINLKGSFRCFPFLCPPDYTYATRSKGFKCIQKTNPCRTRGTSCLYHNPKFINTVFTEINNASLPASVFDIADHSSGDHNTFTNTLTVAHATHPIKGIMVPAAGAFRLVVRRSVYHTTVTIIASGVLPAPMDVRLELRRNALSPDSGRGRGHHLYDTLTFIRVFVTSGLP